MKVFYSIITILLLSLITSCGMSQTEVNSNQLDPKTFSKEMSTSSNYQLIDVRTPEEYSEGHISGALNIDWNGDEFESEMNQLDKSIPVYIYCRSGRRSAEAADFMRKNGFKTVKELDGGILNWQESGLPETLE